MTRKLECRHCGTYNYPGNPCKCQKGNHENKLEKMPDDECNKWYKAIVHECMMTEACYVESDPIQTIKNLVNWHINNTEFALHNKNQSLMLKIVELEKCVPAPVMTVDAPDVINAVAEFVETQEGGPYMPSVIAGAIKCQLKYGTAFKKIIPPPRNEPQNADASTSQFGALTPGDAFANDDKSPAEANIHVGEWAGRIVCWGSTIKDAVGLRDFVFNAMTRAMPSPNITEQEFSDDEYICIRDAVDRLIQAVGKDVDGDQSECSLCAEFIDEFIKGVVQPIKATWVTRDDWCGYAFTGWVQSPRVTKEDAIAIAKSAVTHYFDNNADTTIGKWLNEEGFELLNKLNDIKRV